MVRPRSAAHPPARSVASRVSEGLGVHGNRHAAVRPDAARTRDAADAASLRPRRPGGMGFVSPAALRRHHDPVQSRNLDDGSTRSRCGSAPCWAASPWTTYPGRITPVWTRRLWTYSRRGSRIGLPVQWRGASNTRTPPAQQGGAAEPPSLWLIDLRQDETLLERATGLLAASERQRADRGTPAVRRQYIVSRAARGSSSRAGSIVRPSR